MVFTPLTLCAFCAATNFRKRARVSAPFVARDACARNGTVIITKRNTILSERLRIRADCLGTARITEFMDLVILIQAGFSKKEKAAPARSGGSGLRDV